MNRFEEFNLDKKILKSIQDIGYKNPSEVQIKAIPGILAGKDLIVKSQTGSGKTAAFSIPIIENIEIEKNEIQALILTPTRELAVQVMDEINSLGLYKKVRAISLYGKQPMKVQRNQLSQRVHIAVGTPGRVMDHIEKGNLHINNIKYFVIDEADEMLNMGFIEQVEDIINTLPKNRQTLMFSATFSEEIKKIVKYHMINPEIVEINSEKLTVDKINQLYYEVREEDKIRLLKDIFKLKEINQGIIFCRTKKNVTSLFLDLKKEGYSICEIHGDMEQKDRLKALKDFKEGRYVFIVATDVASRGIDVSGVTHVINYDIPLELEAYVHRIGRTGRAGNKGEAITFVTPYEQKFLKGIEEFINYNIPKELPPSKEELEKANNTIQKRVIKKNTPSFEVVKITISSGKKKKTRRGDIVGVLAKDIGIPADSIGVIDIFDNYSNVDILNGFVEKVLKNKEINIKGKPVKLYKSKE
ncbi:DEAD/DEAH box helicase [Hathewaya histolytica]|uniref:DEAD/DEAH box helicase n=1 Tax=Hathewaya histolytica TaxID=1498 RepID=UPI003B671AC8